MEAWRSCKDAWQRWQSDIDRGTATFGDFRLHLNTLFPEARLKNTIEVRACDAQRGELALAVPALFTGLLYDQKALAEAEDLGFSFDLEEIEGARPALVQDALAANIGARSVRSVAERVVDIALSGLERRARFDGEQQDERRYLRPLAELVATGRCPADVTADGLEVGEEVAVQELIRRTAL
jgi:glutamate--cysteine ligase